MAEAQKWPQTIWIVRHGESAGNVARNAAVAAGLPTIAIDMRDVDVPLSSLGEQQAQALGQWFAQQPAAQQPSIVLASPYLRARHTAELILQGAQLDQERLSFVVDERLREKEFGVLDRLTSVGIAQQYPEQAEFRRLLGKFYHRPPGGESWCDVILRLRNVIDTLTREYRGEQVLIVCHSVVVLCFRYLFERLTEEQILTIDRENEVANCSVTTYEFDPKAGRQGKLRLQTFNYVAPLAEAGTPITSEPDAKIAAKG